MAPYRNSRTGARSTRTQIDHDVFEGLPVRHWRKRSFNINAAPEKDNLDPLGTGDTGWPELPMPRDAHLYSPMSEALLRAARMGQVKKPATPLMDDDKETGEDEDADREFDMGFVAKRWAVLPKDMEGPEPEFLAKRRKGLPSVYTGATGPLGHTAQMRKTKIRKVDTEGNSYIWEVLVPEGQAMDGEIVEEETSPTQAPAPGTVVEGLGVVNAEGVVIAGDQAMPAANRRRPPPPKRKAKGPGRGRKKKVAFMSGIEGDATANGVSAVLNGSTAGADDGKSAKMEHGVPDGDTEMGDENVLQEGEEGSEEGSEGDEGEYGDREEGELSPSPTPAKSPTEPPAIVVNDTEVESAEIAHDVTPSPSKIPSASPVEPTLEDNSDPMLLDADDDEAMSHSFSEPMETSIAQSSESITDIAVPIVPGVAEETKPAPESIPRPSEAVLEEPYAPSIAEPKIETRVESITTFPLDVTLQPLPEPVGQYVTEKITESLAEQPTESLAEPLTSHGTELKPSVPGERVTEVIAVSTAEEVAEQTAGTSAGFTGEAVPAPRTNNLEAVMTDSILASSTDAAPEPITSTISASTTETITEPKGEPEMEFPSGPPTESVMEPTEESEPVAVPVAVQPVAELPVEEPPEEEPPEEERPEEGLPEEEPPVEDIPTEEMLLKEIPAKDMPLKEMPAEEMPAEEMPAEEMPAEEMPAEEMPAEEMPAEEIPAEGISMEEPRMEEIPIAKPRIEEMLVEQPPIEEMPVEQQPLEEPYVKEQPVEEPPVEEPPEEEQSRSEPRARPATEPFPEAISPDRRFSYPRVTTSPQAPTPSPPTPIENTFGLKAPYLSPKAPTMSPPTPIERSMSSSPDIPLADQHFRLPPQIDAAQEADQAPAPDILHVPSANRMSVEVAPNVDTRVNAQLPVDHNLLEGMAEPRVAEESEGSTQHFTDGEEDLLGSLERSLGKQGGRL